MSGKLVGRVLREFGGSRPQQAVLVAYAESADEDGTNCRPGILRIAHETGYEPRHVKRIVKQLRGLKVLWLAREASGRRPPEYRIELEKGPQKVPFEDWKQARMRPEEADVEVTSGAEDELVEVTSQTPPEDLGVTSRTRGVTSRTRRGDTQDTQPVTPHTTPHTTRRERAREASPSEPDEALLYLNESVRRTVEVLIDIETWDLRDRAKTIALVSDTRGAFPDLDIERTARTLAYKMRTGACKRYTKPSKAFSSWAALDAERLGERSSAGARRRVPVGNSIAVVGAREEDYDLEEYNWND